MSFDDSQAAPSELDRILTVHRETNALLHDRFAGASGVERAKSWILMVTVALAVGMAVAGVLLAVNGMFV